MLVLTSLKSLSSRLFCHRAIYTGLAFCDGAGCILTGEPELYGLMAILYALLALKG